MKSPSSAAPAVWFLAIASSMSVWADDPPIRLFTPVRDPAGLVLSWEGGHAPYQVQHRRSLSDPWRSLGEPTTNTTATVVLDGEPAFYRVVTDFQARYRVTFQATWSAATHPGAWPAGAHWSTLVGAVHNPQVRFWQAGSAASPGIERMAEQGATSTLAAEIQPALQSGDALTLLLDLSGGLGSPATRTLLYAPGRTEFPADLDHPLVTLVTMVAPSPDWFVGVNGLSLLENGRWTDQKVVTLFAYDAGTDNGLDFTSADIDAQPRGVIARIEGYPARIGDQVVPFGSFTFTRVP